jgi:hypothetical protein
MMTPRNGTVPLCNGKSKTRHGVHPKHRSNQQRNKTSAISQQLPEQPVYTTRRTISQLSWNPNIFRGVHRIQVQVKNVVMVHNSGAMVHSLELSHSGKRLLASPWPSVRKSAFLHGTSRLPEDGFFVKFTLGILAKITADTLHEDQCPHVIGLYNGQTCSLWGKNRTLRNSHLNISPFMGDRKSNISTITRHTQVTRYCSVYETNIRNTKSRHIRPEYKKLCISSFISTAEIHLHGRWLSGSVWPFR